MKLKLKLLMLINESNETKKDIDIEKKMIQKKVLEEDKKAIKNNSSIEVKKSKNNLNKLIIIF